MGAHLLEFGGKLREMEQRLSKSDAAGEEDEEELSRQMSLLIGLVQHRCALQQAPAEGGGEPIEAAGNLPGPARDVQRDPPPPSSEPPPLLLHPFVPLQPFVPLPQQPLLRQSELRLWVQSLR